MIALLLAFAMITALALFIVFGGPRLPAEADQIIDRVAEGDLSHILSGQTGFAESHGVRIWYETRSPEKRLGVVMLHFGLGADCVYWPPSFIAALIDAGYQVVRYDYRGTGMSDWLEDWTRKSPHLLTEMADDAIAILDDLGIGRAHHLGLSLGGMIAQEVAIAHPQRVASLTLMSTSANAVDPEMPHVTTGFMLRAFLKGLPVLKYRFLGGEKNRVRERIAKTISTIGFDELYIEELAALTLYDTRHRRGLNFRAFMQHQAAVAHIRSRYDLLEELPTPTLVIHGTADPIFPIEHAMKLTELLPNSRPILLEGVVHQFPYPRMHEITREILTHIREQS